MCFGWKIHNTIYMAIRILQHFALFCSGLPSEAFDSSVPSLLIPYILLTNLIQEVTKYMLYVFILYNRTKLAKICIEWILVHIFLVNCQQVADLKNNCEYNVGKIFVSEEIQ